MTEQPELERILADVLDTTEAPPDVAVDAAVGLFALAWRDGELLEILEDSATSGAAIRGDGPRIVSYELDRGRLDIEVDRAQGRITGELDPAVSADIEVVTARGAASTRADDMGRFRLAVDSPAPWRLRLRLPDGRLFVTPIVAR